MQSYPKALTIAGSDSGGGAGVQADLKTFSALGCYGMSVITALTAQNTKEVRGVFPVEPLFIAKQYDAVMEDIGADAVKIGMLHSSEVIQSVKKCLEKHPPEFVVLDPVMVAKSGDKLLADEAIQALKEKLIPLATLITPNLPEASVLLNRKVEKMDQMEGACRALSELGSENVLLKGGHLEGDDSIDFLYMGKEDKVVRFPGKRIDTPNTHGTGCTLSSAIAAFLAKGETIESSVKKAKDYLSDAIEAGKNVKTGRGHGPVHHFFNYWEE